MVADLLGESELSGEWNGYYQHRNLIDAGKKFSIIAVLECRGGHISGTMTDSEFIILRRLEDILQDTRAVMSDLAIRKTEATLEQYPDMEIESILPRESRLEGRLDGERVRFTKTYLGDHTITLRVGDSSLPQFRQKGHRVQYDGALDLNARTIAGQWSIRQPGLLGRFLSPAAIGDFLLTKRR